MWSLDVGASSVQLATPDYLRQSSLWPGSVLVSTPKTLLQVDLGTGQKKWSLPVDGTVLFGYAGQDHLWEQRKAKRLAAIATGNGGGSPLTLLVDLGKWGDDEARYVGPFRFWVVDLASGKIVWARDNVGGRKIQYYELVHDGELRLAGEGAARFESINVVDGSAATVPPDVANERYVVYVESEKVLRCYNSAGEAVWERKGKLSPKADLAVRSTRGGIVVWPAKSGSVEVISQSDGASLWKMDAGGDPRAAVNEAGTALLVPRGNTVTIVRLAP